MSPQSPLNGAYTPRHLPCPSRLCLWAAILTLACGLGLVCAGCRTRPMTPQEKLNAAWAGYKKAFFVDGRVVRPKDGRDTVSEGQAYAMLRAVWLRDKPTFDLCYRWTESNLSRRERFGDSLLAWHFADGRVQDWNAASDADLDYALALLLASKVWPDQAPSDLSGYRGKALAVAEDVLLKEVVRLEGGEMVLVPWPLDEKTKGEDLLPVNPSYFSPAHYRAFHAATGNADWQRLLDDTYEQISRLLDALGEVKGVGIPPDWCAMDRSGRMLPSDDRGTASSWDAFRLWWRLALDWRWAGEPRAKALMQTYLVPFLNRELESDGSVHVEYDYSGEVLKQYTSPAVLGVYAWSLADISPSLAASLRAELDEHGKRRGESLFYGDAKDYYANSWAWFGDAEGMALTGPLESPKGEAQ